MSDFNLRNEKMMFKICLILCLFFYMPLECRVVFEKAKPRLSPVIFVPGDGGSQIEAKLDKPNVVHYICQKHTDTWFNIWLNMELLVPFIIDCWIDNIKLYYDNVTRTTSNSPGVQIRVPGWGDPEVVEWIDPSKASTGVYFKDIGNALVNLGYERKISLRGAPYDFRKAPNENKYWFIDMKKLIEDTYRQNDNTPITLITHSMGSPMSLLLMQQQTTTWKRKYIARIISLAGAWAGSVKAVKVFAMGDDLGSLALSGKTLRPEQITSPSLAWLLPSPFFWKTDEVLVQTPSRVYTMSQMEEFFKDLNYYTGWEMRKDTLKYSLDFKPPDVELYCLYGSQIQTVERLIYNKDVISEDSPKLITGDGDGTVNIRSLKACEHWQQLQLPNITSLEMPGVDHMTILSDKRVVDYILNVMSKNYSSN